MNFLELTGKIDWNGSLWGIMGVHVQGMGHPEVILRKA